MSRVEEILVRCRDSLSDEDKSRWSDSRLLRLVDEAQKKIATKAQLLRRTTFVSILSGQNEYSLPSNTFLLTRIVDEKGTKIEVKSHADMDDLMSSTSARDPLASTQSNQNRFFSSGTMWENDTGSQVDYIIFDNQEPGKFKTYPIVTDVAAGEVFVISDYGVTVDVEDDVMSNDFGVVVDITEAKPDTNQFNSDFGVVVAMAEITEVLKVYYRAKPGTISAVTDTLEIDDKWDAAIKHYVVGMALHDNQDTQSRSISADEIMLYNTEFAEAVKISSKDNASRSNNRTSYNPEI